MTNFTLDQWVYQNRAELTREFAEELEESIYSDVVFNAKADWSFYTFAKYRYEWAVKAQAELLEDSQPAKTTQEIIISVPVKHAGVKYSAVQGAAHRRLHSHHGLSYDLKKVNSYGNVGSHKCGEVLYYDFRYEITN